jgi:hypothetical protein
MVKFAKGCFSDVVVLDGHYRARIRDATDLDVLHCKVRGIKFCDEFTLLERLARDERK